MYKVTVSHARDHAEGCHSSAVSHHEECPMKEGEIMQPNSAKSMLHTLLFTVSTMVVCLLHPGLSSAASPKVDVCHREGDGSFHLVTIADPAVEAHRAHGD